MTKDDINFYLSGVLGDRKGDSETGEMVYPDYSSNEGYGKLRDMYDGWDKKKRSRFLTYIETHLTIDIECDWGEYILHAFHRDNLAGLMLEFLKSENDGNKI